MGSVVVSAQRISSMLANRHQTPADLGASVSLSVDPHHCSTHDTTLSFEDLVALGKHFKRPWSYLLIDEPEVIEAVGQDNRSLRNQRRSLSPALIDQIDAVAEMLAAAAELFPDTRFQTPPERIAADSGVSAAGRIVRTFLGISDSSQLKAKDDFEALRLWGDALQRRGVYVSQRSLKDETIRAFSRIDGAHAVVVVDTGDTPYARIFSLLHEYVHIILRSTGICDLDDHSTVERLCNSVAAAALMPAGLVRSALGARAFTGVDAADDELLQDISRQLRVSQAALLVRLLELGKLSAQHFGDMEARRSSRRRDTERSPGGQYYPVRINRVGRRYARDVLGALDTGQIDRQDASSLLEIGEHLLPTYRQHLDNGASEG